VKSNFDLEPQPGGGFTVSVPALPEVVTEGDTEAEAMRMAEEAIRAVLEYRRDHGLPMPRHTPRAPLG
jgi:antitoxin HicB